MSKYSFNLGDTTATDHKKIDRIETFSGGTWVNKNYNADFGGKWCFIDSFVVDTADNGYAMQRITATDGKTVLATRFCSKGTWGNWDIGATKSDLFGELCTNPNTLTAFVAMVNGYDSNVTNIPDAAKKKFSIIQNVWASTIDMGDLTKTHMQVLIIGNGGGVVTRKYESSAWSNWQ